MGKALIIAEKPSVAGDIAKALGGFTKQGEYFESERFVISSAVGHLLELTPPEGVEAVRGKWSFKNLPVIPGHFDLRPIEKNESRLKVLAKLIKRKDVETLVNACDAGREGELIFRNIIKYTHASQKIQRLWLQSMTPTAIRDGFAQLRTDQELQPLADAAYSRSEADWLVGINGTRAMTAFNSKLGGFHLTTVGRVQTPTMAIVVEREEKIRAFRSRDYWEVIATFEAAAGSYTGRWIDEKFTKNSKDNDAELKPERLWQPDRAEAIKARCEGRPGVVTEESKPTTQMSPLLFDLTSLQREANNRFGFSASRTLSLAQALYERHKVLTYPRTDARALPEDYPATVKETLQAMAQTPYGRFADTILKQGWVRPANKRIFNNAKISDHFAIIPTTQTPKNLNDAEQRLYDMVTKRFLAVFFPPAEFQETTRITRVAGEPFKSVGKVLVNPGWLAIYGKEVEEEDQPNLAQVGANEQVQTSAIEVKKNQTKPPPRYTEATLLSAMEGAGKLIDDDEMRYAMADKGLGTPATRASIIEGLVRELYMQRLGKELQPTAKAFSLMALLNGLGIAELTRPELTGEWEHKLRLVQRRQKSREEFMAEIAEVTRRIVDRAKQYEHDTVPGDFGVLQVPCPKCGGEVHEKYKTFHCLKCDFSIWKIILGRQFENAEVESLITQKVIGPLQNFRSKLGRPFAAMLKLTPEFKVEFDFGEDRKKQENGEAAAPVDFTGQEPVGACPKCAANVFESGMHYVCEKSTGSEKTCDFRASKVILQQPLDRIQMAKLLATGKTDLLDKFISKRNGRTFKAFMALDKKKNVGFEFAPREAKGKAGAAKKAKEPAPTFDFSGQAPVGKCPRCGGGVYEGGESYICEKSQAETKPCKFKFGRSICQQPVSREEAALLLETGRSRKLDLFMSRFGKHFSAFLVLEKGNKVGFEFPPRDGE
jgi:DNA topoisomerase-3